MIDQLRQSYPVKRLCCAYRVAPSSYYAWKRREETAHAKEDERLTARIRELFNENRQVYGAPRIHEALRDEGETVSRKRVARLMREAALTAKQPRKKRVVTTKRNKAHPVQPNYLNRQFEAQRPNEKWCTDITYIRTTNGWVYLAVVIDLFSRMIVGWATDKTIDSSLVKRAWRNALVTRQPKDKLLHHSDRGSQYTGQAYQRELQKLPNVTISMSRTANCLDNAVVESFFGTLKNEVVSRTQYRTLDDVHSDLFDYIECFYNRRRKHSNLGYLSPAEFEKQYQNMLN